jgi:hypothetical protein
LSDEPTTVAARTRSTRRRWVGCALLVVLSAVALWAWRERTTTPAEVVFELGDISFGAERALVRARWSVRGEVQRFGLGVARVDSIREVELDTEGEPGTGGARRWRARLHSARQSQSFVLGTENLLEPAPRSPLASWVGASLHYVSEGGGKLHRAGEHPRLDAPSGELEGGLRDLLELRALPCPERLTDSGTAREEHATWRLPEGGGSLELRWRARVLQPPSGPLLRIAAEVDARWWRAGSDRAEAPTRTGAGTAAWEIHLGLRRFERFELAIDGVLEPDPGAEPEVSSTARLVVELHWDTVDRDAWAWRAARGAARVLARLLAETFQRGWGS